MVFFTLVGVKRIFQKVAQMQSGLKKLLQPFCIAFYFTKGFLFFYSFPQTINVDIWVCYQTCWVVLDGTLVRNYTNGSAINFVSEPATQISLLDR